MIGRTVDLRSTPDADLTEVAEYVRSGGVVAYPTDTVYGLGSACTERGVETVRRAKAREAGKPLIALVRGAEDVAGLAWTDGARELTEIFWPGSLTVIVRDPDGVFPPGVRSDEGTVAVRHSPFWVVERLLEAVGAPVTSTSLNVPGETPAENGEDARYALASLGADDVWLLDAGSLPTTPPSTLVDCTGAHPHVVREGAIPVGRLRCVLPGMEART